MRSAQALNYLAPFLRGEVELRSNSGEGLFETPAAPHPNPLPARGARERTML